MKSGGKICALGLGKEKVNIPMALATMKEIEIIGSCRINDESVANQCPSLMLICYLIIGIR